jgi:hypothetical protein
VFNEVESSSTQAGKGGDLNSRRDWSGKLRVNLELSREAGGLQAMEDPEDYLRRAEEAEEKAATVFEPLERQFLEIARQWRELARRVLKLRTAPTGSEE